MMLEGRGPVPSDLAVVRSGSSRVRGRLVVRDLSAGWGSRAVLRDVSLRLRSGERVALLGPNGAGKSTLFDVIAGRLTARTGTIQLGRETLDRLPAHHRARLGLGYVSQEPTVFADLSVRGNLEAGALSPAAQHGGPRKASHRFGAQRALDVSAAVDSALRHWNLEDLQERNAGVLSGGERRRVEVARALLARPRVLLLDEPFAGLDPEGRAALKVGLSGVPSDVSLLVTDHSHEDVLCLCDRALLLVDGRVVFDGPSSEVMTTSSLYRRPAAT